MAHGALTPIIGLRLLALAGGLRHNAEIGQPGLCFSAYGHKFGINHLSGVAQRGWAAGLAGGTGCRSPDTAASMSPLPSAWYSASRRRSRSSLGKNKKTTAAPMRTATIPAVYAHWSPCRKEVLAAAVI